MESVMTASDKVEYAVSVLKLLENVKEEIPFITADGDQTTLPASLIVRQAIHCLQNTKAMKYESTHN